MFQLSQAFPILRPGLAGGYFDLRWVSRFRWTVKSRPCTTGARTWTSKGRMFLKNPNRSCLQWLSRRLFSRPLPNREVVNLIVSNWQPMTQSGANLSWPGGSFVPNYSPALHHASASLWGQVKTEVNGNPKDKGMDNPRQNLNILKTSMNNEYKFRIENCK